MPEFEKVTFDTHKLERFLDELDDEAIGFSVSASRFENSVSPVWISIFGDRKCYASIKYDANRRIISDMKVPAKNADDDACTEFLATLEGRRRDLTKVLRETVTC